MDYLKNTSMVNTRDIISLTKHVGILQNKVKYLEFMIGNPRKYISFDVKFSIEKTKIIAYVFDNKDRPHKIYKIKLLEGDHIVGYLYDYYDVFIRNYEDENIITSGCFHINEYRKRDYISINMISGICEYMINRIEFDKNGYFKSIYVCNNEQPNQKYTKFKKEIDLSNEKNQAILKKIKTELFQDVLDFMIAKDEEFTPTKRDNNYLNII